MHCIYLESVKLAPAYFVGYLIFHLFDNYELYNQSQSSHLGYAPPTLLELLYSLLAPSGRENIHPAQVSKKAVRRNQISRWSPSEKPHSGFLSDLSEDAGGDIEPVNYREFPFSDKLEYPMFRAEDALAPSKYTGSTSKCKKAGYCRESTRALRLLICFFRQYSNDTGSVPKRTSFDVCE